MVVFNPNVTLVPAVGFASSQVAAVKVIVVVTPPVTVQVAAASSPKTIVATGGVPADVVNIVQPVAVEMATAVPTATALKIAAEGVIMIWSSFAKAAPEV